MEITLKPTVKQHEAYEALKTPGVKTVFLGGGAGGGKSWFICESRLVHALRYPGYKSFIGREELKRLMQSTFVTWNKVCSYHKVPKDSWRLDGKYNYIEFVNPKTGKFDGMGSRIDLLDLKYIPSDPLYERFGSLEYTDGSIEEAGEIHFLAYDVLKSRINRHENDQLGLQATLVVTGNPKTNWTKREFYKPWKAGTLSEDTVFIQSLYIDNPHSAKSYGEQLSGIQDKQTKERLMFGNWDYDSDPAKLFDSEAVDDLFTNTITNTTDKYLVSDIARFGQDRTVIGLWEGWILRKIWIYAETGIDDIENKLKIIARDEQVPYSRIIVDEDGVGGGVKDNMKGIKGFIANSTPFEIWDTKAARMSKANFSNLKAQCYFKLADKVNSHEVAIEIDNPVLQDQIAEELGIIKQKDPGSDGKISLIKKEDMKELLGKSPDIADMLMMRAYFEFHSTSVVTSSQRRQLYQKRQRNIKTQAR